MDALHKTMSDREMCLCRELTKTHEEIVRKPILDFTSTNVLGEVTLVIGPGEALKRRAKSARDQTCGSTTGRRMGMSKREAYNLLMTIKPGEE